MISTSVDMWYDRTTRNWVVQVKDEHGNQIGDAVYVYTQPEALLEKARLERRHGVKKAIDARIASIAERLV